VKYDRNFVVSRPTRVNIYDRTATETYCG